MKRLAITLLLVLLPAGNAYAAGHKSATLAVKATVQVACTLSTPSFNFSIGIGAIRAPGSLIEKQGALFVQCTKNSTTHIAMNSGLYGSRAGSRFGSRSMGSSDGAYLGYDLCHDSACTSVWTPSGYNYTSPSDAGSSLPVWTVIHTGQNQVKQNSYSDSVIVTISF